MSLEQLRYFVVVAEEEHMTRAAERLRISQPPLSRQMRALEEELGARLFRRTSRGLRLLPDGKRLLEEVRPILASLSSLRNRIAGGRTTASEEGSLSLHATADEDSDADADPNVE